MSYTDETKLPFGKQFKGEKLEEIPDWYFKHFWKMNDKWYKDPQHRLGNIYASKTYDYQRYKLMEYIEENFEPKDL